MTNILSAFTDHLFGLGEVQHLDVLLSGYRGLGEPRSGNGVPNLQRREACAIGLLFEPYPRVIISVPWGLVAPGQICVCGSAKDLQVLLPTNRLFSRFLGVVAVKLRLLSECLGPLEARGQRS
ncbi:hypothetical protein EVAR_68846_1 [Eumeta japonica]|uniref:Uncharacterized protein n=1 Tax=Eumeta variegata TaxID=151549 RepID=A0A4C1SQP8_EUMVA|nr:hypothetical protein EVAR_68846_1 [Eumeta japonica]